MVPRPFVVESVDDPIFAPEMGEMGVYHPTQFLAKTQSWVFSVGTPDFSKVQVVLVHGIDGTPRDFRTLIPSIDPSALPDLAFLLPFRPPARPARDRSGSSGRSSVRRDRATRSPARDRRPQHGRPGRASGGQRALQVRQASVLTPLRVLRHTLRRRRIGGRRRPARDRAGSVVGRRGRRQPVSRRTSTRRRSRRTSRFTFSSAGARPRTTGRARQATARSRCRASSIRASRPPRPE